MKCQQVIEETREVLRLLGIDERRLRLKWISASEGAAFAEEIYRFVDLLLSLGDNPFKIDDQSPPNFPMQKSS